MLRDGARMDFDLDAFVARLQETLADWAEGFAAWLPNLMVGLVLVFVFWMLAKLAQRGAARVLSRSHMHDEAQLLFTRFVRFAVLVAGLMITLSVLQLDKTVTSLLAGAGVVGLALGLAFQPLATNFISGVGLSLRRPFSRGDVIESNGLVGIAEEVAVGFTTIRTFDGKKMMIPNKKIDEDILTNHSDTTERRAQIHCGVGYASDLGEVERVVKEALEKVESRVEAKPVEMFFESFGDSAIEFRAHVWFDYAVQRNVLVVQHQMIMEIKKAFDRAGITIPFPIRTLDFGIEGGTPLTDMWPRGTNGAAPKDSRAPRPQDAAKAS